MQEEQTSRPLYEVTNELVFPPVEQANWEGVLAIGGDLSPERLLLAYKKGIFPWYSYDSPIIWWSPNPRMVLFPNELKVSKSMKKVLKGNQFSLTKNTCFKEVIHHCGTVARMGQDETWITDEMQEAYIKLHEIGVAVSYEVWENEDLVGGLYGIDLDGIFCGESMFSLRSNASKYAFIKMVQSLAEKGCKLIDCQVYTNHLESMGAREIPREEFLKYLPKN